MLLPKCKTDNDLVYDPFFKKLRKTITSILNKTTKIVGNVFLKRIKIPPTKKSLSYKGKVTAKTSQLFDISFHTYHEV